jgi:uncharacterized protein (TIGR00661 family)
MQILYGIQGTGNGHIARAKEIVPQLRKLGEVDILLSGTASDLNLPFHIDHRFEGISLFYNSLGGVDYVKTWKQNPWKSFVRDVWDFPILKYDVIISDFEPVSAWAAWVNGKDCVGLGHQAAFLSPKSPRPLGRSWAGENVLKRYSPTTHALGFHFKSYDKNIELPLLRKEILDGHKENGNRNLVYLPAYGPKYIQAALTQISSEQWDVFHPNIHDEIVEGNIHWHPINGERFTEALLKCKACIMSAGFEGPAEALYLKKKLLVIPIARQYEQACNAAALQQLGVKVISKLDEKKVEAWLHSNPVLPDLDVSVNWLESLKGIIASIKNQERELARVKVK